MPQHKSKYSRLIKTCALILIILFTNTNLTLAAPTWTDIEEQNRKARQEEQERRQRERGQDVFLQKEKQGAEVAKLPDETPSFTINTIMIQGDESGQFPWVHDLVNKYLGQKIGWQGINIIVKTLTNACIDRGFITTQVLIPEQNLSTGVLRLQLVPGMIKDIKLADPKLRANWQSAFPARPGDILNLRDLEQGLEQMKRVPSQDAEMQLVPGDNPGESIVLITVKQTKPWKLVLSLDDSGSEATGKLQASETFSLDNLFGINDLFNISYNSDAERHGYKLGTRGNSFYYSVPHGYWTYTLSGYEYKYHQTVESDATSFVSSGRSNNLELKAEKLIYRDQTQKTSVSFGVTKARSKSFIDDTEIEIQRRETTAAELAFIHKKYNGQTVIEYTAAYKRGVPWFGAQEDPAANADDQPTTHYNIWTLDTRLSTPVTLGKTKARYSAILSGQYTKDMLYASEFMSIGNRYTVRGFDGEETLSAENGWFLRNELSVPLRNAALEFYLGLDIGQVSGASVDQSIGRTLAGSTFGLRGNLEGAQYDMYIGKPIKKPAGMQTSVPILGFQVLCQI
ncbi:ShlB/FhaC/HecB family hemolysin secretion/activation protein [Sporomusa malonica]|uniref:Hemolysin activation/secretion protein n=1 Tax=Sporomusa malonica TaxID=112901 RepID=A0A1W2ESH4_9FIRM|nr:ShlB/FhaC/HecB family hemolysin secretion/activation protein [Sporomusa malonica]SMD12601.1 hemolysin activation/secretion protein [Sporomusa malonica]